MPFPPLRRRHLVADVPTVPFERRGYPVPESSDRDDPLRLVHQPIKRRRYVTHLKADSSFFVGGGRKIIQKRRARPPSRQLVAVFTCLTKIFNHSSKGVVKGR